MKTENRNAPASVPAADTMTEAAKIEAARRAVNREYCRRWRQKHRKKANAYHKKWRKAHPEYYREYYRKWRKEHPDKIKEYKDRWYLKKYEELCKLTE